MNEEIINPFKQQKTNWAQKSKERLIQPKKAKKQNTQTRVAKSFKIYKGTMTRTFDKRVNKMQVHFDDLDYSKNHIDSGKYIMFLMAFAEKYKLYNLYKEVDGNGNIEVPKQDIINNFK